MGQSPRRWSLLPAVLALAACGGAPQDGPAPSPQPAAPATATPPPRRTIGAILMQQDQFFRLNESGMRAAAEAGGADLRVQNSSGALDKEAALIDTFLTQKVDAILVSPLSSKASVAALDRAHQAGIRVITYNNSLDAPFPAANITSDQASLGALSGQAARALIEGRLGGKARVALIGFASQLPEQGGARQQGFKQALAGLAGVELVAEQDAWNAPEAATAVGQVLGKQPDIVWAANEGGTVGAVNAVRTAGKAGKVFVFGTDVSAQLLDFLEAGDGILQAVTAQQPVEMGRTSVETALQVLSGQPVERTVVQPGRLIERGQAAEIAALRQAIAAAAD